MASRHVTSFYDGNAFKFNKKQLYLQYKLEYVFSNSVNHRVRFLRK